jgi:hypothetical protein
LILIPLWAHFEKVVQGAAHQTKEKDNRFSKFHRPDLYRFQEKDFGNLPIFLFSEKVLDIRTKSL